MIEKLNYFSDEEQNGQKEFAERRTQVLLPIARALDKINIKPDHISYFALFLLIPFTIFFKSIPLLSSFILLLYVALDGIDGSLARYQNADNLGGAFTDIIVDQMGIVVIIGIMTYYEMINPLLAYIYIVMYIVMIAFSVVQNALNIPMQKLLRSKYIVYLLYIITTIPVLNTYIESLIPYDLLHDIALILFSIIMTITNLISYKRLKHYLSTH